MKLVMFLSLFLLSQCTASFFDDIVGTISSVQDTFGKVLGDVISDVKVTIDCTVLAVERVIGDIIGALPEHDKRCKDDVKSEEENKARSETNFENELARELETQLTKDFDSSVSKINDTLCKFLSSGDTQYDLEKIKGVLENETDRLKEVNDLLKEELENISDDVKKKLKILETDFNEPTVDNVWDRLNVLYDLKKASENDPLAIDTDSIFERVRDILDLNKSYISNEKLNDIPQETLIEETNISFNTENNDNNESYEFPKSFKDVFKRIQSNTDSDVDENNLESEIISTLSSEVAEKRGTKTETSMQEYSNMLGIPVDTPEERKKAIEDAKSIIEKGKYNAKMLNSYFNRQNNRGMSVFD